MPNWTDIEKCTIWKTLGVIECNNCEGKQDCWPEAEMPEPKNGDSGLEKLFGPGGILNG